MKVTIVSNGYGEDSIALNLIIALKKENPNIDYVPHLTHALFYDEL